MFLYLSDLRKCISEAFKLKMWSKQLQKKEIKRFSCTVFNANKISILNSQYELVSSTTINKTKYKLSITC